MIQKKGKNIEYQNWGGSFVNISQVSDEATGDWNALNVVTIHRLNDRKKKPITNFTFSFSLCITYDAIPVRVNLSKPFGQIAVWEL